MTLRHRTLATAWCLALALERHSFPTGFVAASDQKWSNTVPADQGSTPSSSFLLSHPADPTSTDQHRLLLLPLLRALSGYGEDNYEEEDFDRLNELFRNAEVVLPDLQVSQHVVFANLNLNVHGLRCQDLRVHDLSISMDVINPISSDLSELPFTVSVRADATCYADYSYTYGILRGSGNAAIQTQNNQFQVTIAAISESANATFGTAPPSMAVVQDCEIAVEVTHVDLYGGFVAAIADAAQGLVGNVVERSINGPACTQVASLGADAMSDLLRWARTYLETPLEPLPSDRTDPLILERVLVSDTNIGREYVPLLDYQQNTSTTLGGWVSRALEEMDGMLSKPVPDAGGPTGTDRDMAVNVWLREHLLDSDHRCWRLDVSSLSLPGWANAYSTTATNSALLLLQTHGRLADANLTLDAVQVCGLDTMRVFDVAQTIGRYTLQSRVAWEYATIQADVTVSMMASTQPDAWVVDPDPSVVVEHIQVEFGVDQLELDVSVLLPMVQEKVLDLELGSLLFSKNLIPCLLSVLLDLELSGLDAVIGNLRPPTLQGFVSPGLDRLVSNLVNLAFVLYEPTLLRIVPNFFQGMVRDFVQQRLVDRVLPAPGSTVCPPVLPVCSNGEFHNGTDTPEEQCPLFLDFRELLLSPEESLDLGGTGSQQYGDVGPMAFGAVKTRLFALDSSGLPKVNEMLLRPWTKRQSGDEGELRFPGEMASLVNDLFELRLSDLRVLNLDTLAAPVTLLQPTYDPLLLENKAYFGNATDRPLSVMVRLLLSSNGSSPSIGMRNDLTVMASVDSVALLAGFKANVDSGAFMSFPLRYLLNFDCWMALFPSWSEDLSGFDLIAFLTSLSALDFSATCAYCTSSGMSAIPEVVRIFRDNGAISLLQDRFGLFVASLLTSDAVQDFLSLRFDEAHVLCPASPSYLSNATRSSYSVRFPTLSAESVDTLVFAATMLSLTGFLVFAESHAEPSAATTDESYHLLDAADDDARLVDWTDLHGSLGLIGTVLEESLGAFKRYLSKSNAQSGGLEVNAALNSFVLDQYSLLHLEPNLGFEIDNLVVSLKRITVSGLDTFTKFDVLRPISSSTLRNGLALRDLGFNLTLAVGYATSDSPIQHLNLYVNASNISAIVDVVAAIDLAKLGGLEIGTVFNTSHAIPCLLSTVRGLAISRLELDVESFGTLRVLGLMNSTSTAISSTIDQIESEFGAAIRASFPLIWNTTARSLINTFLHRFVSTPTNVHCDQRTFESKNASYVDFRDLLLSEVESRVLGGEGRSQYGDLFRRLYGIITDRVINIDSSSGLPTTLNTDIIGRLTKEQSGIPGRLNFSGDLFRSDSRIAVGGLDATVTLRLFDGFIENLDSIGAPLVVLAPVSSEPHQLNSTATIGIGDPLKAGLRFAMSFAGDDLSLMNDVDLRLEADSLYFGGVAILAMLESSLSTFPFRDLFNLHCWLSTIPGPALDANGVRLPSSNATFALKEIVASVQRLRFDLLCLECTSPALGKLSEWFSTSEGSNRTTVSANVALEYAIEMLEGDFLQGAIDRSLNDAPRHCPHREEYESKPQQFESFPERASSAMSSMFVALAALLGGLILGTTAVVLSVRLIVRRRFQRWLKRQTTPTLLSLWRQQSAHRDRNALLNESTASLFKSSIVPCWIRLLIPVVVVCNIGFFLSGHLSVGATVVIDASFADERFTVSNVFEFSMARSTVEIWNAGGRVLAMLILIFSGVWPYTKQLFTLFLWFAPPKVVSVSKRGSMLQWLDIMAKWSIVDIFVLIVTVAGFRLSIQSPNTFLPDKFYSLDLLVVPMWGLYANMIAQFISQISSHFIVHYHRRVVMDWEKVVEVDKAPEVYEPCTQSDMKFDGLVSYAVSPRTVRLARHGFTRPHRGDSGRLVARRSVISALLLLTLSICMLVALGCTLPSFSLRVLGVVGIMMEFGQTVQDATTEYSLFGVLDMLFQQASITERAADYVGLGSLSVLLVLSVLIVPIVQSICLLVQWLRPVTSRRREQLSLAIEILAAWQYAEVYVLAVVIACWQLGPVSDFMVNTHCKRLSSTFAQLVFYGLLDAEDAQCFRVEASIARGSYLLVAASLGLTLLNTIVASSMSQYLREQQSADDDDNNHNKNTWSRSPTASSDQDENEMDEASLDRIRQFLQPPPVLFTDTFRWLLVRLDLVELPQYKAASTKAPTSQRTAASFEPWMGGVKDPDDDDDDDRDDDDDERPSIDDRSPETLLRAAPSEEDGDSALWRDYWTHNNETSTISAANPRRTTKWIRNFGRQSSSYQEWEDTSSLYSAILHDYSVVSGGVSLATPQPLQPPKPKPHSGAGLPPSWTFASGGSRSSSSNNDDEEFSSSVRGSVSDGDTSSSMAFFTDGSSIS